MTIPGQAIDRSQFQVPGRGRGVLDVFRKRYLLELLIRKGTSTRYRRSVLGWVWSYVKPGAQFAIYYFVMGIILQANGRTENFAIYLFSGIVMVNLFNEAFGNATTAIVDNQALVRKIYLPRELFPLAAVIGALIHFLPQLAILLVVCLLVGWLPSFAAAGALVLAMLLVLLFSLGLGLFFSALNARFRDAQNFVELIRMFSTWTSPVLYSWELIGSVFGKHEWLMVLYNANPLTAAVELLHFAFWEPTVSSSPGFPPDFLTSLLCACGVALLSIVIGQLVFRRMERTFAQDL